MSSEQKLNFCTSLLKTNGNVKQIVAYLVSTGGYVGTQGLHLAVEDVVFLHLILHGGQVLTKALIVQVVLGRGAKQSTVRPLHHMLTVWT